MSKRLNRESPEILWIKKKKNKVEVEVKWRQKLGRSNPVVEQNISVVDQDIEMEGQFSMGGSHSIAEEAWQLNLDFTAKRRHLLTTGLWSDVQFEVGDNRDVIKAHRQFLASASPVFEAMLYGPWIEREGTIRVPDVSPETFNIMLRFIYTDTIESIPLEKLADIDYVSKKYLIPRLMKAYAEPFLKDIRIENVDIYYEFATAIEYQPLIDECLKIFTLQIKEVLNSDQTLHFDMDILKFVFSMDELRLESEFDLLDFIEIYAKANEIDMKNNEYDQSQSFRPLLQQIRFLSLSPEELSKRSRRLRDFLTESELLSIILNASHENVTPMPDGFSTNKSPRDSTKWRSSVETPEHGNGVVIDESTVESEDIWDLVL